MAKAKPAPHASPPADRSALDAAEEVLRRLDDDRKAEEAQFRRRQDELDDERKSAQATDVDRHNFIEQARIDARAANHEAGGEI